MKVLAGLTGSRRKDSLTRLEFIVPVDLGGVTYLITGDPGSSRGYCPALLNLLAKLGQRSDRFS